MARTPKKVNGDVLDALDQFAKRIPMKELRHAVNFWSRNIAMRSRLLRERAMLERDLATLDGKLQKARR